MKINSSHIQVKKLGGHDALNNFNPGGIGLKFNFLKQLKEFFYFKGLLISNFKININSNKLNSSFSLFFTKKKLLKLKKKIDRIKLLASTYKKKLKKKVRIVLYRNFSISSKKLRVKIFKSTRKKLVSKKKNYLNGINKKLTKKIRVLKFKDLQRHKSHFKRFYFKNSTCNKVHKKLLKIFLKKKRFRRKKRFFNKLNKKFKTEKFLFKLFKEFRLKFRVNLISIKINVLNKFISKFFFRRLKKKIRYFKKNLFSRRFNFFIDFVRLTSLYKSSKINLDLFLNALSDIFRRLTKKIHSRFLKLIKELFKQLILSSNKETVKKDLFYRINNVSTQIPVRLTFKPFNSIQGIKFALSGKVKGKLRARTHTITIGPTPVSTLNKIIEFSQSESYTVYGVFGLKLWVYRL